MTAELSDQAAREAACDLGRTCFVEASAGTGKTRLLCDRALAALLTPGYDPAHLAAITFTEKAAAELAARLRAALEAERRARPRDEQAAFALARFDQAQVSTIHAFAASLLRELPAEAGLDPAFEVVDEGEAAVLFEEAWDDWIRGQAERPRGTAAWEAWWAHFAAPRTDELAAAVRRMAAERDFLGSSAYEVPEVDSAELEAALAAARRRFEEVRGACWNRDDACYRQGEALAELAAAVAGREWRRLSAAAVKLGGNKSHWKPPTLKDELNEQYFRPVAEALARLGEAYRRTVLPAVAAWLQGAGEAFARRKEEAGVLDFHDLLERAAALVRRRDGPAREYFQRRFRHLLVDEFQDTDPLQVELVFFLAEEGAVASEWREVQLVPGKLFVVGDPKQSIYRFRRADIATYAAAREVVAAQGGEVLRLRDNFRAAAPLISFVNDLFGEVFGPGEAPYQPAYGELYPSAETRRRPGKAPGAVVLEPPEGAFATAARAAEGVAAFLWAAVEDGGLSIFDRECERERPLAYGDVAVLLRKRADGEAWEGAFERWGLPFYTHGGRTFYVRPEVKALAAAATALDNPAAEAALVAALTSPLFSFTADDLLQFKLAGGAFDYRREVPAGAPPRWAEAFATLRDLHDRRLDRSAAATVAELVAGTGFATKAALWGDGARAVANLRKVVAAARRHAERGGVGLRGFAAWLGERAGREEAEHESPALDAGEDFVRLMTIHAAKGLEFPAVVFPDWTRKPRRPGGEKFFLDRRTGLFHARVGSEAAGTHLLTPGYEAAAAEEDRFGRAEERRLDYVAATRARDILILPRLAEPGEGSLAASLQSAPARHLATTVIDPERERSRRRLPPAAAPPPDLGEAFEEWRRRLRADVEAASRAPAISAAAAVARGEEEEEFAEATGRPRAEALRVGRALHAVMERVDLRAPREVDLLVALACRAEGLAEERWEEVRRGVENCLASAPAREAAAAPARYREMPFAVVVGETFVAGKIDLAYEISEGLVIADYKTGPPAAAAGYRDQLAVYAAALGRVTGRPVARAYLIFAGEEGTAEVEEVGGGANLTRRGEELLLKPVGPKTT
jgi:ATP-dependent helicase/nuclease subunit A